MTYIPLNNNAVFSAQVTTGSEARPGVGNRMVLWDDKRNPGSLTPPTNLNTTYDKWMEPVIPVGSSDTTAPTVPTGLTTSSITSSGFTATWTASTDAVGVTAYEVRADSGSSAATVTAPTVTYNLTGLSASTSYAWQVRARDAAGNWSAWATISSPPTTSASSDVTAPSVPTGLTSSSITSSGFTATWTASTDAVGVTAYEVRANSGASANTVTAPTVTYNFTGLSASTAYPWEVRARDAAGNWSSWATISSPPTTSAGGGTPPAFDAVTARAAATWTNPTAFTYTAPAGADVFAVAAASVTFTYGTVTYGGANMTQIALISGNNVSSYSQLGLYRIAGAGDGTAKSLSVGATPTGGWTILQAFSYTGVVSISTAVTAFGFATTAATAAVTLGANQRALGIINGGYFAAGQGPMTGTSGSGSTERYRGNATGNACFLAVVDSTTSGVVFGATFTASSAWSSATFILTGT